MLTLFLACEGRHHLASATTKKQSASIEATGVMRNRSDLLRDIAFIAMPSNIYMAMIHTPIVTKAALEIGAMRLVALHRKTRKIKYRTIDSKLEMRSFVGSTIC